MRYVTLDIETYYAQDYSLSSRGKNAMTMEEYINDPRFLLHGIGVKVNDGVSAWFTRKQFEENLPRFRRLFKESACIAHNAPFDMAALAWHYECRFGLIVDTLSMARPVLGVEAGGSLAFLAKHFELGEKGRELIDTKGKRDLTVEELDTLGGYCINDVDLTWALFQKLKAGFPREEIAVIDRTIRMFVEPAFMGDVDRLKQFHLKEVMEKRRFLERMDACKEDLQSNDKFAEILISL